MRNRAVLLTFLFAVLSFAFFSLSALVFAFIVPEGPATKAGEGKESSFREEVKSEDMIHFGSRDAENAIPNVFDATMRQVSFLAEENLEALAGPKEATIEEINAHLDNPERCLALQGYALIGTGVAIPESESFAILSTFSKGGAKEGGDRVALLRVDDELDAGTILAAVRRNLVAFKTTSGVRCLGENVGKEPQSLSEEKKEMASGPGDLNVQQTGPNSYRLSRDDLTRATANLNSLASEARIVPDKKEGGFKIFSIKPDSIWQKIGIQNGDVVKSINGIELSSPDKALEAYGRLRNANRLSLDVVRRGKRETMEYSVE